MAIFTLEEARALLPRVKELTQQYFDQVECFQEKLQESTDAQVLKQLEHDINVHLHSWAMSLKELGVEVKGLWLADFDSGDGYYYCWRLGEDDIEYFHRYETGFAGRRPITLLD